MSARAADAAQAFPHNGTNSRPAQDVKIMDAATWYMLILFAAFVGILAWAFGRKRKARFERDAKIPFKDKNG
jgi:cbb3-type cytochrome oxidase subunit 3